MARYAAVYGTPDLDLPWPWFIAQLERLDHTLARQVWVTAQGVALGIRSALGEDAAASDLRALQAAAGMTDDVPGQPPGIPNALAKAPA